MRPALIWIQLIIGWLPVWALFALLIVAAHPMVMPAHAALVALRSVGAAALLGHVVYRLTARFPWPTPFRPGFILLHVIGAALYSVSWLAFNSLLESALRGRPVVASAPAGLIPYLILGAWLYGIITGVAYAARAVDRATRAEAHAARAQLATLRSQLNPHFLFNALHTVVHLIPREPTRAAQAAEQLADLLRTGLESDRDLVALGEEWDFVNRYLDLERIRFGDRLRVEVRIDDHASNAQVPSFSVQTLVENAVRHAAAPRIEPTLISVRGTVAGGAVLITVSDDGGGFDPDTLSRDDGTGLRRLRDRIEVLYGTAGTLTLTSAPGRGCTALLRLPGRTAE